MMSALPEIFFSKANDSASKRVLREAGLVDSRKDGLQVFYRLSDSLTEELLRVAFGDIEASQRSPLEGCSCPHCSAAVVQSAS